MLGVDHELRDAGAIPEVDEHEAAVIAAAGDPAGQAQRPTDVLGPRLAAHEVSPAHGESLETISSCARVSSARPGVRSVAVSGPTTTVAAASSRRDCVSWPLSERPA